MSYFTDFLPIGLLHLLAVATPGPDFAVVVHSAVTRGRASGIYTSLGVGLGFLVHATYVLAGLGVLVERTPQLFTVLKWGSVMYLAYLGVRAMRGGSPTPIAASSAPAVTRRASLLTGFLVNGLNPKASLWVLTLFTISITRPLPLPIGILYAIGFALIAAGWFTLLATGLSGGRMRLALERWSGPITRVTGVLLLLFATRLTMVGP